MALVVNDRVKEESSTTGTGTLTLTGAVPGFETFSSAIGNTNTTYYAIQNQDTPTEFEVGLGTVGAGTLSRDTILSSSNSDAAVNFSAGTKDVFCTLPASKSVILDSSGNIVANNGSNLTNLNASNLASGTVDNARLDADLAAIAGLTSAADKGIQFTGSGTAGTFDLTTAGKALLDDADAAAQRTTLGLGTVAELNTVTLTTDTTGDYVASLTAGNLIDLQNNSGEGATPTIDVDLSELSTSTSDADGDFFVVVDDVNAQKKLTKANINISGFNNDSGFTTNTGTVTQVDGGNGLTGSVTTSGSLAVGAGTGIDVAAINPAEAAAARNVASMASAFGLEAPAELDMGGMPTVTAGGMTGYSSYPMFTADMQRLKEQRPDQYEYFARMTGFDPITGAATQPLTPTAPIAPVSTAQTSRSDRGESTAEALERHYSLFPETRPSSGMYSSTGSAPTVRPILRTKRIPRLRSRNAASWANVWQPCGLSAASAAIHEPIH